MKKYVVNGKKAKDITGKTMPWERGGVWDLVPLILLLIAFVMKGAI